MARIKDIPVGTKFGDLVDNSRGYETDNVIPCFRVCN